MSSAEERLQQLREEVARVRASASSTVGTAHDEEIARLRQQLAQARGKSGGIGSDIGSAFHATPASASSEARARELQRLREELARQQAAPSSTVGTAHDEEIARLRQQLAQARASGGSGSGFHTTPASSDARARELQHLREELARQQAAPSSTVGTAYDAEIERLRQQIANKAGGGGHAGTGEDAALAALRKQLAEQKLRTASLSSSDRASELERISEDLRRAKHAVGGVDAGRLRAEYEHEVEKFKKRQRLKYHIIFCLDASGSMCGEDWDSLMEAVWGFLDERHSVQADDLVTVITYSCSADVVCEARPLHECIGISIPFEGGGTSFAAGLRQVIRALERTDLKRYKPLVLFMSDGYASDGDCEMIEISDRFGKSVELHTLCFGGTEERLQELAERGGGTFSQSVSGSDLVTQFRTISASMHDGQRLNNVRY
eukprot:TRINITY_DN698_c0_g1_i3.p1 TRINITY_DN698_c0_g1~~TRINITY_DN698_c0_g1_i3.p1  ORF type:complete len:434 (+),score=80.98 TRINITY_DN698_c0_g1_i3:118-1419(+)